MNILLVGGGGREHAIASALKRSSCNLYAAMKNKNPGIVGLCTDFILIDEKDTEQISNWAVSKKIDMAIIGPDPVLEAGIVDRLEAAGIKCASPTSSAARIETSKIFMRNLMQKYDINGNIDFKVFRSIEPLVEFLKGYNKKFVIKPEGLTGGKGVKVMGEDFNTVNEGIEYAKEIFLNRIGGSSNILLEELVEGEEFSLQAFCDGTNLAFMPLVQDFKRAFENDEGPNTGGMGSYSMPDHLLPFIRVMDYEDAKKIMYSIAKALKEEHAEFKGILYGQFMITRDGPKVIEVNARFADPESINVLSILKTDMVKILKAIIDGTLDRLPVEFEKKATVVKYIVPKGYGTKPAVGEPIYIDYQAIHRAGALLYYAAVNEKDKTVYTTSSRALALVGIADNIFQAENIVESAAKFVSGNIYIRHDIAKKEMFDKKMERLQKIFGGS
ncbi:MAG: phosphoribosylamine--glycine ligase [Thermoplasmata archaeon]